MDQDFRISLLKNTVHPITAGKGRTSQDPSERGLGSPRCPGVTSGEMLLVLILCTSSQKSLLCNTLPDASPCQGLLLRTLQHPGLLPLVTTLFWNSLLNIVLVNLGFCNKIPQSLWPTQQKPIFSQFWRLEVQIRVPSGLAYGGSSLPGQQLADFSLCPHKAFLLCLCGERGMGWEGRREMSLVSLHLIMKTTVLLDKDLP